MEPRAGADPSRSRVVVVGVVLLVVATAAVFGAMLLTADRDRDLGALAGEVPCEPEPTDVLETPSGRWTVSTCGPRLIEADREEGGASPGPGVGGVALVPLLIAAGFVALGVGCLRSARYVAGAQRAGLIEEGAPLAQPFTRKAHLLQLYTGVAVSALLVVVFVVVALR